jgi:uncharacterized protein (DUF3084 family)
MESTLSDQLILNREVQNLQSEKSRLEDSLEQKKRELLSALDLSKKESEKIKGFTELQVKIQNEIHEAKIKWNAEKLEQEEELKTKQTETTKILNRENYVKLQEQKLKQFETGLFERENKVNEREQAFIEREEKVKAMEEEAQKHLKTATARLEKSKSDVSKLKESILKDINNW